MCCRPRWAACSSPGAGGADDVGVRFQRGGRARVIRVVARSAGPRARRHRVRPRSGRALRGRRSPEPSRAEELRADGRIRAIGAGMNQWQMELAFAREGYNDCFLLAGRYTLLDQTALPEFLPYCVEHRIARRGRRSVQQRDPRGGAPGGSNVQLSGGAARR